MPINRDLNILFVHIPKCAGTSLATSFGIDPGPPPRHKKNLKILYGIDTDNSVVLQSLPFKFYDKYLNDDFIDSSLKITCVRNPYIRAVSDYIWSSRKCVSFYDFLKLAEKMLSEKSDEEIIKYDEFHSNHFLPQYKYIEHDKYKMDVVLKIENLQEEFNMYVLPLFPKFKLVHVNKNKNYNYMEYYKDKRCIDLINKLYQKDFEMFGYEYMI